jgi:sec-independent protein translocase protein TatA
MRTNLAWFSFLPSVLISGWVCPGNRFFSNFASLLNDKTMLASIFLFGLPGSGEMILIFGVVLLLFGGKKVPELMKGIGKGMREFNDAKEKVKANIEEGMKPEEQPKKAE